MDTRSGSKIADSLVIKPLASFDGFLTSSWVDLKKILLSVAGILKSKWKIGLFTSHSPVYEFFFNP